MMPPLLLIAIAGIVFLWASRASAGAGDAASMSDEQLAAFHGGKAAAGTPADVVARFVKRFNAIRAAGGEGWVMTALDPGESSRLPADWHYLVGRLPGPVDASWWSAPGLIWRRFEVKKKEVSKVGQVVGQIGGSVIGTIVGGPVGAEIGSTVGSTAGGFF